MQIRCTRCCFLLLVLPLFFSGNSFGQNEVIDHLRSERHDTTYISSYARFLTGRFYFSQKYTHLAIEDANSNNRFNFRANTSLNMGVGATYGSFTLNLAYGFEFLNPDRGRGDTRWLDLQSRIYGRRYIVDLYGQFYNGLYLNNSDVLPPGVTEGDYYVREDLKLRKYGFSGMYVFNNERFSYRAPFVQNEWQKKSAGSVLVGWEIYAGHASADSSLLPLVFFEDLDLPFRDIDKIAFFEMGPSVGYVYTYVYKKRWFATAHLSLNFAAGWISEYQPTGMNRDFRFYPNFTARGVIGYNSPVWFFGATMINNSLRLSSDLTARTYILNSGNFRLNFVRRFMPGPKAKRYLKMIEPEPYGSQ